MDIILCLSMIHFIRFLFISKYIGNVFYIRFTQFFFKMVSYRAVHELCYYLPLYSCLSVWNYYYTYTWPHPCSRQERSNEDISRHYSVTMLLKTGDCYFLRNFFVLSVLCRCLPTTFSLSSLFIFYIPSFTLNIVDM